MEDVVDAMIMAVLSSEAKGHIINIASGIPVFIRGVIGGWLKNRRREDLCGGSALQARGEYEIIC